MSNYISTQYLYINTSNTSYLLRLKGHTSEMGGFYPRGYWSYWRGVIGVTGLWG